MRKKTWATGRNFGLTLATILLSVAGWAGIESKTYPLLPGESLLQVLPRVQGGTYLILGQSAGGIGGISRVYVRQPLPQFPQFQEGYVLPASRVNDRFSQTDGVVFGGFGLHVVRLDAMDREVARFRVGGEGYTAFTAALLDSDGSLVILGETSDRAFPVKNPVLPLAIPQEGNAFTRWGFLAKTDPAGTGIAVSTLIGGVETDEGPLSFGTKPQALARDGAGNLYVAGTTTHRDFPVTASAYKKNARFDLEEKLSEGFLLKVDRHLRSLLYSTFLGSDTLTAPEVCPVGGLCGIGVAGIRNEAAAVRVGAGQQPWVLLTTTGEALPTTPGAYVADLPEAEEGPTNPFVNLRNGNSASLLKLDSQGGTVIVSAFLGSTGPGLSYPGDSLALLSDGSPVALLDRGAIPSREVEIVKLLPDASAASAHHTVATRVVGTSRRNLAVAPDNSLWLSGSLYGREGESNRFEGIAPSIDLGDDFLMRLSGEDLRPRSLWMLPNSLAGPLRTTPFGVEMASPRGIVTSVPFPGTPGSAILGVRNAAGPIVQSTVSPYEFLTLEGVGLGLPDAAPPQFDRFGNLPRMHEGVRVTLDGVASPLLSVSAHAVTLIAPESLAAKADKEPVELALEIDGQVVARYPLFANGANPRFFTSGQRGARPFAAAVNQNGFVNSEENPAKPGESVSLYLNGVGAPTSAVAAGKLLPAAGVWSTLRPMVTGYHFGQLGQSNDNTWEVGYFGIAPGLASGTVQLNVRIPEGFLSGVEAGDPTSEAMLFATFLPSAPVPPEELSRFVFNDSVSIWVRR